MTIDKKEMEDLINKYKKNFNAQLQTPTLDEDAPKAVTTQEYTEFKSQYLPKHMTFYENACRIAAKVLKIQPDAKKIPELKNAIRTCHLTVTPEGVQSLAILAPLVIIFFGGMLSILIFGSPFLLFVSVIVGASVWGAFTKMPYFLADNWRLQASNQMVLCIFYVVTYMRHTSNLELAVEFAANHLNPPLSLDLKKVLWDVETQEFATIKESLDFYLDSWKQYNMEFVESFHLVMSSLYETDEARRVSTLEKALSVILEETYEKMLHYAYNLKSPITMLHMLGIILPILGLVILPLVVSFMKGITWYHIAVLYNFLLPAGVYFLGKTILSKRPTGYGNSDISQSHPDKDNLNKIIFNLGPYSIAINPVLFSFAIGIAMIIIGFSPVIMHALKMPDATILGFELLGYRTTDTGDVMGPYGFLASLLSLLIPMGIALLFGLNLTLKTKKFIKIREEAKKLEIEFASALFQLGNRLGDGLPAEIAFSKVSDTMVGTNSGKFFDFVSLNIRRLGMSVEQAIFDTHEGALSKFPSNMIESSMKVLTESVKKGPLVAAQALMNVSEYIKEMHKVDERLKDLLQDVISSMQSQIKFLTPTIAGIVIGITSMITSIIGKLRLQMTQITDEAAVGAGTSLVQMFSEGIPTYYFQIIVGVYVVQIIYILTVLANGIENGSDKLNEKYTVGTNLMKSTMLYCVISFIIMIIFNIIANQIMKTL
ncbi:hypothetical protein JW968_05200 [Candidatus Woesearchaeota archaeon]|nr:hypothetical protein [Candidatus Woesearchaeota archaeon]